MDDYGPELQDNPASVERLVAVLEQVGAKSGFTAGESTRLCAFSTSFLHRRGLMSSG